MAKSAKTGKTIATAGDRSARAPGSGATTVTEHDVARRAYALYVGRGGDHGHDLDDWLRAERELRNDPER
jgi:hypothetical protein